MRDSVLLATAWLLCVAAFSWLALAMDAHWRQVRGEGVPGRGAKRVLRLMSTVALAASLVLCLRVDHASMASLVWVMMLAASALCIAFALTWRPRWLGLLVIWIRPESPRQ